MRLIVTKHAEARMFERNISVDSLDLIDVNSFSDKENGKYSVKLKLAQGFVEVVFEKKDSDLIIITAY